MGSPAAERKYGKTPKGFLVRKYRNMKSRVEGIQKKKAHLYAGLPLLDKEDFYSWALSSIEFWVLFKQWELSGYSRKLCPSVDRIDSSQGYEIENMQWLTHSQNSKRPLYGRKRTQKTHCKHGHEFTEDNTYVDKRGYRHCRECNRERGRIYRETRCGY